MDNISKIFPNMAAELDEDLGNVRIQLDSQQKSQEDELLEYFGRYNLEGSTYYNLSPLLFQFFIF